MPPPNNYPGSAPEVPPPIRFQLPSHGLCNHTIVRF